MKFDSNCKVIIDSMNYMECKAYIYFLDKVEIPRHRADMVDKCEQNRLLRNKRYTFPTYPTISLAFEAIDFDEALIKFNKSALPRHRQDIKSTKDCILKAEDRMDMLELLK